MLKGRTDAVGHLKLITFWKQQFHFLINWSREFNASLKTITYFVPKWIFLWMIFYCVNLDGNLLTHVVCSVFLFFYSISNWYNIHYRMLFLYKLICTFHAFLNILQQVGYSLSISLALLLIISCHLQLDYKADKVSGFSLSDRWMLF